MRLFVNYSSEEKNHLTILHHVFRSKGYSAIVSDKTFHYSDLQATAKSHNVEAIILINQETLKQSVSGKSPTINEYRGSVIHRNKTDIPILCLNSLKHVHTVSYGKWLLERDLEKLATIHNAKVPFTFTPLRTISSFEQARQFLRDSAFIAYDIETTSSSDDTYITCVSWTGLKESGEMNTFVLPFFNFGECHWKSISDMEAALEFLREVNSYPAYKIMQNGMYDLFYSIRYRAWPKNYAIDTMYLAHAKYSELPKTLDFLASLYCHDYQQWKFTSEQAAQERDIQSYWAYNAMDTFYTMRIAMAQIATMQPWVLKNYADKFPLIAPLTYMAFEGFKVDEEVRKEKRKEAVTIKERALEQLRVMVDDPDFNPGSPKQVAVYLYDVFAAKKVRKKGKIGGTDELTLKAIALQHPILARFVERIFEYRKANKAISTYFDYKLKNGRLLYQLKLTGTETERLASEKSMIWGHGAQIQNFPSYAKETLIADSGFKILEHDFSQAEARCTAVIANEPRLHKALNGDVDFFAKLGDDAKSAALAGKADFYTSLGTLFFGIPYSEVTKFFRNKVLKKIVHGTNYVMGAGTFIDSASVPILMDAATVLGINIPKDMELKTFARMLLEKYHETFPNIRQRWYKSLTTELATTGQLVSPLKNVRVFFGKPGDHKVFSEAVAHQPQNLSVTLLNKGLYKVWKTIVVPSKGNVRLKAQVHDSIVTQVKADLALEKAREIRDALTTTVRINGYDLNIPVDAEIGDAWKPSTSLDLD